MSIETKPTLMYCELTTNHKGQPYMQFFFQSKLQVRMCVGDPKVGKYLQVEITKGDHNIPDGYWGWWNIETQRFEMVFASKVQVEVCFPYGSKAEEDRGRGKLLPLNVRVIGEVDING
jgi:hypothetical protein